jgi:hypothetical protein
MKSTFISKYGIRKWNLPIKIKENALMQITNQVCRYEMSTGIKKPANLSTYYMLR